jgi:HD superfamily phosphohydrolase YqeK
MMIYDLRALSEHVKLTGSVAEDVPAFLTYHGYSHTAAHCAEVAAEAARVARLVGEDEQLAATAGWLHDTSVVFPNDERLENANALGIDVLPEEADFPMIIHQKLSVALAREVFGIREASVLSAVGCHTTLKAGASRLDKVLFVADKLAWDQAGKPPFRDAMLAALDQSLDHAALAYLRYLWERRETLRVVHPWMREAYVELSGSP